MSKKANLLALFRSEPMQWGLRGNPFLWRDMKRTLKAISFPATEADLIALLEKTLRELTGHELPNEKTIEEEDSIFVEEYAHGGIADVSR